ncbi:hypothetical protein H681_00105 [Pseudomonas sp. ATCC 13867]|uniref:hypothetical protein n=1 Tax=unclassified Pseudomonas TaxID=196821 RepID=UPI0002C4F7A0|nr:MULTISPECIES: hypothetical protein [unclassified Pseudomonas]AGI21903.1 hypothetical protein H681_00105 [Pseudomonas sp. ATCC 13867]
MITSMITLELTEGDRVALWWLKQQAVAVATLLYPDSPLEQHSVAALLTQISRELRAPVNLQLVSDCARVEQRLLEELGRAALSRANSVERQALFDLVYPRITGDNYAHKRLSCLCSSEAWPDDTGEPV